MTLHHYALLGVHRHPSKAELDAARRRLARTHHPDHGGTGMAEVNVAYDTLADTKRELRYLAEFAGKRAPCGRCKETGFTFKTKGFTGRIETICKDCAGMGLK